MKNKFILSLAFSMFILAVHASGSPVDDGPEACWQKGIQLAQIAKDYVPGRIYWKLEKLDGDGKTVSQKETWLELQPAQNQWKLLKVIEDGKDITREELEDEKIKKEGEKKGKKSAGSRSINLSSEELVPLLTNSKKAVATHHLGREMDRGVECHVFKFQKQHVQKKGTEQETLTQQGKVWLDANSGMPVRSTYTLDPLPSMVQQMDVETTYYSEGDMFFIKTHKMTVKVGILFLKKRFRFSFVMGGHRKPETENKGR